MSFQQGLSGLNAASRNLDVIGHNISNAGTIGMKSQRAEFAEVYASSAGIVGGVSVGLGVEVGRVTQQFSQGSLNITGNDLDIAINGSGFYQVTLPDGSTAYTRAGAFKLDRDGNIVDGNGSQLMGYNTDTIGNRTSATLVPLQLPTSAPIPARASTELFAEFTLDATSPVAATATPPTPVTTYGTSITAYDSQGIEVPVGIYFSKTANNTWDVYTSVGGSTPALHTTINFNATGGLVASTIPPITLTSQNGTFSVNLDLGATTQSNTKFGINELQTDGYPAGTITGMQIEESGVITATYSNGQTQSAGQIALVNFRNVQGLTTGSNSYWKETYESGQPIVGAPGEGQFGLLRSGTLEESNVDITAELVSMMTAQRAYQANAQTIKTQDQVMSTLVNLR
ncbi:MAG: flagellar hook protein FlgE [Burkholderiales bacterium]|jgi:flagellar hook protein FlgE|nr:flagellar hook protein FlgE [Burkholderiales bacterium]